MIIRVDTYFNCEDRNLTDGDLEHGCGFGLNPIQLFLLKTGHPIILDTCTIQRVDND